MPFTGYEPLYNTVMELVASGVKIYEPEKTKFRTFPDVIFLKHFLKTQIKKNIL